MCLCRGPSRTSVHHVRCYVPTSPSWSFGFKFLRVPSVYVFVRTCVCACACCCSCGRGLVSVMFPRTVVQYASSRPLPRQHILFERPFWLLLRYLCSNTCPSHIEWRATGRLVPAHTHRNCVLGPSRFLQVTDGLVLSRGSSAAQQNGGAVPCCHPLFIPVVV